MSNETLIRCCVPAMAGPKTGNMIVNEAPDEDSLAACRALCAALA